MPRNGNGNGKKPARKYWPVSPWGIFYPSLSLVPRWSIDKATDHMPAILNFRDRAGQHKHAVPYDKDSGDSVALLRDMRGGGFNADGHEIPPGDTLCLIFNEIGEPEAILLRYSPAVAESAGEAHFKGREEELQFLRYPPNKDSRQFPTLNSLKVNTIAKRMALRLENPGTHWNACGFRYR